jgi:hypothetical protein
MSTFHGPGAWGLRYMGSPFFKKAGSLWAVQIEIYDHD